MRWLMTMVLALAGCEGGEGARTADTADTDGASYECPSADAFAWLRTICEVPGTEPRGREGLVRVDFQTKVDCEYAASGEQLGWNLHILGPAPEGRARWTKQYPHENRFDVRQTTWDLIPASGDVPEMLVVQAPEPEFNEGPELPWGCRNEYQEPRAARILFVAAP